MNRIQGNIWVVSTWAIFMVVYMWYIVNIFNCIQSNIPDNIWIIYMDSM
jgi:hypothetical protein